MAPWWSAKKKQSGNRESPSITATASKAKVKLNRSQRPASFLILFLSLPLGSFSKLLIEHHLLPCLSHFNLPPLLNMRVSCHHHHQRYIHPFVWFSLLLVATSNNHQVAAPNSATFSNEIPSEFGRRWPPQPGHTQVTRQKPTGRLVASVEIDGRWLTARQIQQQQSGDNTNRLVVVVVVVELGA